MRPDPRSSVAPSLIVVNGKVATLDGANPQAEAIAIADGLIVAAASERDIRALAGPAPRVTSLPPPSPDSSPVRSYGGYPHAPAPADSCACTQTRSVHGHSHHVATAAPSDLAGFWGALGRACFAF